MPVRLIDPRNEVQHGPVAMAPRHPTLAGRTVALLDISKPGSSLFLDRLAARLERDVGVARVVRAVKPTFSKLAPAALLDQLRGAEAVVLALAD